MLKYKLFSFALVSLMLLNVAGAQISTRADSLRGMLGPFRTCYDVLKYELDIEFSHLEGIVDLQGETKYPIVGMVNFHVIVIRPFERLQIDLFAHLKIDSIVSEGQKLKFSRLFDAVFVDFPSLQAIGKPITFKVFYRGDLIIAKRAPWDGGFIFTSDKLQRPWIGVACEGFGASSWWPCKDHLSDEPDSGVVLNIRIPRQTGLMAVGNGKLIAHKEIGDSEEFSWEVKNPINSYNVSVNIGAYSHFTTSYTATDGEIKALDFYVLDYQLSNAKAHFAQVGPMLSCFEALFGPYAFWEDGYKMVETPYWGMEHQSAVAYGNNYRNNKWGFDFIIIHESAHEWWGNSVSVADHADMWIHEGFTTYAETIYLECVKDQTTANQYLLEQRRRLALKQPMVGPYDVNFTDGDTDVYFKGAWLLHTMRNSLGNDSLFFSYIKSCYEQFFKQVTNTENMLQFWLMRMGEAYRPAWEHYLYNSQLPVLVWQQRGTGKEAKWYYRYEQVGADFYLPLQTEEGQSLVPSTKWQAFEGDFDQKMQRSLTERYLIDVKRNDRL